MLLGSDNSNNNEDEKLLNGSTSGHNGLFNSNNTPADNEVTNDDLVSSSFAISFKANDPINTVSEKLKEQDSISKIDDEFENFEFDSSFNPFKPASSQVSTDNSTPLVSAPIPSEIKTEIPVEQNKPLQPFAQFTPNETKEPEIRKPDIDASIVDKLDNNNVELINPNGFPEVPVMEQSNNQNILFENDDPDLIKFAGDSINSDKKLFDAGNELDFATSENSMSSFSAPENNEVVVPTVNVVEPVIPKVSDVEVTNSQNDIPTAPEVKKETNNAAGLQTYGQVSSGVNAFGKRSARAHEQAPANNVNANIQNSNNAVANNTNPNEANVTNNTQQRHVAPANPPKSPMANNNTRPAANANSPFAPKGNVKPQSTRGPRTTPPATPSSNQTSIQPVTTVNNKKKRKNKDTKKKEKNGVGGVITLIVVLLVFLGFIWFLDTFSKPKSKLSPTEKTTTVKETANEMAIESTDETTTEATSEETTTKATTVETTEETTTVETTEETTESTTVETTEETTEATTVETTEETTEATTVETTEETTEATTVETTEETTETTIEATTVETTEETTESTTAETTEETTTEQTTTTSKHTSGDAVFTFYTKTTNFAQLENGFSFDLVLENYGNVDADLKESINTISMTLRANAAITNVSCSDFKFTESSSGKTNTFVGTPSSIIVAAGETYTVTITVTTDAHVNSFGVSSYYIDWND